MKGLLFTSLGLIFCALMFVSCGNNGAESRALLQDSTYQQQLIIGDPVSYSLDSFLLFPVGCNYHPVETGSVAAITSGGISSEVGALSFTCNAVSNSNTYDDRGGSYTVTVSDFENRNLENGDIRNLVFYNKYSGNSRALLDRKLHILSFSIHHEFGRSMILYKIVKDDYNGDKKFDGNDPVMLFVSDLRGQNLVQLTPDNEQYLDYFYYKESGKMLLKVRTDGDKNKKFDAYDRTIFREINIRNPGMSQPVFGERIIDNLTKLL